jgi:hypothetical protein
MLKALLVLLSVTSSQALLNVGGATEYVNRLRVKHVAPPLMYNSALSVGCAQWASHLLQVGMLEHSDSAGRVYGESVALIMNAPDDDSAMARAVDRFYSEMDVYDPSKPEADIADTGHYTQLVWASSKLVGFGMATAWGKTFIVLRFDPPGNMIGSFGQNVFADASYGTPSPARTPSPSPRPSPARTPPPSPRPSPARTPPPSPRPSPARTPSPSFALAPLHRKRPPPLNRKRPPPPYQKNPKRPLSS